MLLTLFDFETAALWQYRLCFKEFVVDPCPYGIAEHSARELGGCLQILVTHLVARRDVVVAVKLVWL